MNEAELQQREHYNRIIAEYEAHYDDRWSQEYRRRFLYDPLFAQVPLQGARVLEAMCGSGPTTAYLKEKGARVVGLDISDESVAMYRQRWPDGEAHCASLLDSGLPAGSFDVVMILGGLHHLPPRVHEGLDEIHRLLRVGGHFVFGEPHAGSFPDVVRRAWYRMDHMFADNEQAVDLDDLERYTTGRFRVRMRRYVGTVAYLLVLNSMILRVPRVLKGVVARPLMAAEALLSPLNGRRTSCFALCHWEKVA